MAKSVVARVSEAFEYSQVYIWKRVDDIAENMSEESVRDLETFGTYRRQL